MVTVSFDFSQIPAQWVARNSCGKKVVKSVGRGARRVSSSRRGRFEKFHPGQGGEDWFFSSKSAFPFATFLTFSRNRGGRKLLLGTILAGNSVCWRGKEDFGRGINKYVNIFPVEEDSSKEDSFWIEDQRGATSINCFEARILRDEIFPFSFSTTPWRKSGDSRIIKSGMHPFPSSRQSPRGNIARGEIVYHRTSSLPSLSSHTFVMEKDSSDS